MTIKDIQFFLSEIQKILNKKFGEPSSRAESVLANMVKITEETGELADQIMKWNKRQRNEKGDFSLDDMGEEIADVIFATTMLACDMGIDLELALEKKKEKIVKRFS